MRGRGGRGRGGPRGQVLCFPLALDLRNGANGGGRGERASGGMGGGGRVVGATLLELVQQGSSHGHTLLRHRPLIRASTPFLAPTAPFTSTMLSPMTSCPARMSGRRCTPLTLSPMAAPPAVSALVAALALAAAVRGLTQLVVPPHDDWCRSCCRLVVACVLGSRPGLLAGPWRGEQVREEKRASRGSCLYACDGRGGTRGGGGRECSSGRFF